MKKKFNPILIILLFCSNFLLAQINLVVTDFSNNSDIFFLDSWERSVPDLLRSELAQSNDFTILDREKLDAVFEEQKLALAGFIDSSTVQEVGQLVGAEFIVSGSIQKVSQRFRIDVNITRVKTGEVHIEKAIAPDSEHLDEMIELLVNNIQNHLTGKGKYKSSISISGYPTKYFLGATIGLAGAAILFNQSYLDNKKKYDDNLELEKFDTYYDDANNSKKIAITAASLGGTALLGTLYCWLKNRSIEDISAGNKNEIEVLPGVCLKTNQEVRFSVQIRF